MTTSHNPRISPAQLALAVKKLRAERESLALLASDPIAIIGMACRFPGGDTPEAFWTALQQGRNCVDTVPESRWNDAARLEPRLRQGGYLDEIDGFDAAYFGITPREAREIDPQQRLLLEVLWEALWDAGIAPESVAGSDTGVFAAIYNHDFARLRFSDAANLPAHGGVGAAHSVAAGRISFLLNLRGPSLALDTACSSSLVATHLACQSLRAGECSQAIVASSSLKLLSDEVVVFSKWGMLAADGKCKTFDAGADGFVPGDGSGVVVLKRLADALRDGDRVHAVIRGSAMNHDGRTTVLTAPNGLAQEAVLRAALENARLAPGEVSYVETHGTGTSLGDPIEVEALGNVYGRASSTLPCVLGAVKTNLGHLEASAGMAGLIKVAMCLRHGEIPRNLHFERLNPEISLEGTRIVLATENRPWPRGETPRVAGISSFGLGGTNAHLIVEEAPLMPDSAAGTRTIPLPARKWQRQKFPIGETRAVESAFVPAAASGSPVLIPVDSAFVQGNVFVADLNTHRLPYLAEHRLGDRAIAPFALFLEMAASALPEAAELRDFHLRELLFVSAERLPVQALLTNDAVTIAARQGTQWKTKAQAKIAPPVAGEETVDLPGLRARLSSKVTPDAIYRRLENSGLHYGRAFRVIQSAFTTEGESLAHLRVAAELESDASVSGIHPTLLDGCLQSVMVAAPELNGELYLPVGVDAFSIQRRGLRELWVHTRVTQKAGETIAAEIAIADSAGTVVARLSGFTAKRTSAEQVLRMGASRGNAETFSIAWRTVNLETTSAMNCAGERWLLAESRPGSCAALAERLRRQGAICEIRAMNNLHFNLESLPTAVVLDTRGLHAPQPDMPWANAEQPAIEAVLQFVKAVAASTGNSPKLCIVTASAVAVLPLEDVSVEQAPLWSLVRTLALEYPETGPLLVDAGRTTPAIAAVQAETEAMLCDEILSSRMAGRESEALIAFRNGRRYVARMVSTENVLDPAPRKLRFHDSGRMEEIEIVPAARIAPGSGDVEIQVHAAGLNFRDVLTAMGAFPPRVAVDGAEYTPGAECAGTIVRVGQDVRGLHVGDAVLAFAPGGLQSFATVPAEFVAAKPAGMTFAEAAGIPVAFLTAYCGLETLAKLRAGQTILIHAAAGGLGLAAVQLALRVGARVFATAGSEEKRVYLRQLGVEQVFDSRSLEFSEAVLKATGGAGVDVVLNSLAGEFLPATFAAVARGGCLLEVGKRGIWTEEQVAALKREIRYYPFDLGEVALANPTAIGEMLRALMPRFSTGELLPLPASMYSFAQAPTAFRDMAQARHIGKLVFAMEASAEKNSLHDCISGGTVLVTGGSGALGIETARWLAAHGAARIVLASRNRETEPAIAAELRARGITVDLERADVADADALHAVLARIRSSGAPLRAVFHAAGVARDAVLAEETWSHYREATAAKIQGAWNLHWLTRNDPVRLMVFYSSAASILGSPGQGSYAAGNAFLDALAHHRVSCGLRTLSVNWGAWAEAGMAARLAPEQAVRWTRQGATPMTPAEALGALTRAIESGQTQAAILRMDWQKFLGASQRTDAAFFRELAIGTQPQRNAPSQTASTYPTNFLAQLCAAKAPERKPMLVVHVQDCARKVMGLTDTSAIDNDLPLQEMGLDSLMALEMRNDLAQSLETSLPAGLLFDIPAVNALADHLLGLLFAAPAADLSSLSEEEAEQLLIDELDRAEREKAHA